MRILNINYSDTMGGAARVVSRHQAELSRLGIDSKILVQYKNSDNANIYGPKSKAGKLFGLLKPDIDSIPLAFFSNRSDFPFYIQWLPTSSHLKPNRFNVDIIHLHWISGGTLRIESLARIRQPIIWTLHDMWPFTGGCSHSQECQKYEQMCVRCPHLSSSIKYDLSYWIWRRKKKALKNLNIIAVAPSTWLAEKAKDSALFKDISVKTIPNGLDLHKYRPIDKNLARSLFNLPSEKKIILFGAYKATQNPFKGFKLLVSALNILEDDIAKKILLCVFGASDPVDRIECKYPILFLDHIYDDISLKLIYSAADIFVAPSKQDNLPNTVMEAMACGTPCVGFNVGGIPDLIDHKQNGCLANHLDIHDLAENIKWLIDDDYRLISFSQKAREKIENTCDIRSITKQYIDLYNEAIDKFTEK